jgi:hypothetical protein
LSRGQWRTVRSDFASNLFRGPLHYGACQKTGDRPPACEPV